MTHQTKPFAEIIESSLSSWRGQCWQWDEMQQFGTLLKVTTGKRTVFGLVHDIQTGSADSMRTVFTYKKTEEELQRDHPHIFEFLQTTFSCITLGYKEDDAVQYQLAPEPPKIHMFVQEASVAEVGEFFSSDHYLHVLFAHASQLFSLDELLLATLQQLSHHQLLTDEKLARFVETFSLLTANDYRRLKLFLQRVDCMQSENRKIAAISPFVSLESS